jgi:hypothetical protein
VAKKKLPAEVLEFFRAQGSKGGKKGSAARMEKLTPEQRSAIAKKAVDAREAKRATKKPTAKKTAARRSARKPVAPKATSKDH